MRIKGFMQNVVFLPNSPEIRTSLVNSGKDFLLVKVNSQSYLMVITNQIRLISEIAAKHSIPQFYISDSRRQTYRLELICGIYLPDKLGLLKRSEEISSPFSLTVTEDNKTYKYSCK